MSDRPTQRLVLVAALSRNRVIGADGAMPWHLPDDLRHFKRVTMGHPMVMGRRTFDAIGRPLPGRRTIVVTRDAAWAREGVETAADVDAGLELAGPGDVMIVGGGQIFDQTIDRADRLELTYVHAEPEGDTYFPAVDESAWEQSDRREAGGCTWVTLIRPRSADPTQPRSTQGAPR